MLLKLCFLRLTTKTLLQKKNTPLDGCSLRHSFYSQFSSLGSPITGPIALSEKYLRNHHFHDYFDISDLIDLPFVKLEQIHDPNFKIIEPIKENFYTYPESTSRFSISPPKKDVHKEKPTQGYQRNFIPKHPTLNFGPIPKHSLKSIYFIKPVYL